MWKKPQKKIIKIIKIALITVLALKLINYKEKVKIIYYKINANKNK